MSFIDSLHPAFIVAFFLGVWFGLWIWSSFRNDGPPPSSRRWVLYRHHLGNYMHRWILRTPFGNLRVHHILRSDEDAHLHDHPFDFTSFLLSGGYREIVPLKWKVQHADGGELVEQGVKFLTTIHWPRFSIVRKAAEEAHRLILDRPVWTFVISGPKRRAWGFHTELGWVNHRDYLHMYPEVVRARVGELGAEKALQVDAARRARGEAP